MKIVDRARALFETGQVGEALKLRKELRDAVIKGKEKSADALQAQAMTAYLDLMMLDKTQALKCLEPFLIWQGEAGTQINRKELAHVTDPFLGGLITAQLANLLYRSFNYEKGEQIASEADALLRRSGDATLFMFLTRWESRIWRARLAWRCGRRQEAEHSLQEALENLGRRHNSERERGGIELLMAVALSLWAAMDWVRGRLDDARRKIYQSLFLLRGGEANDPIRLAYALYTGGKIEASYSSTEFEWPIRLLCESEEIFRKHRHPFLCRATIQRAQCLVKAGRIDDAEKVLGQLAMSDIQDPDERAYAEAESGLTRLWISERRVRNGMARWQDCLRESRKLLHSVDTLPRRLQAEIHLHHGRALIHLEDRNKGREHSQKALEIAERDGRIKIQAGAYFVLTESFLGPQADQGMALHHWKEGLRLLANVQSSYLSQWKEDLAPRIEGPIIFSLPNHLPLARAKEEFMRDYLRYHCARAVSLKDLLKHLGISRASLFRWMKELGIKQIFRKSPPR
jgi:tetratricopeptide (TPR) repeat protein